MDLVALSVNTLFFGTNLTIIVFPVGASAGAAQGDDRAMCGREHREAGRVGGDKSRTGTRRKDYGRWAGLLRVL